MFKLLLLASLLVAGGTAAAQQFGGHPPSTRWRQINTDSVRVIFPAGLQREAAEVTGMIHRLAARPLHPLGKDFRKISIVLQPRSTISNGYVSLGPWRSEFLLTPLQNSFQLGSISWHRSLALHEFRHVEQYNNFRKGISRLAYYLAGQQGQELVNSAAVPDYFWEGDAVYQETQLSEQGRGRLPNFFNGYRSLWAAQKEYSWMKLRNGSLRDYVPDHYRLGYLMVAYGYEQYGNSFWGKVTDDAARYRGLFYPWQKAIRKYSGQSYPAFRDSALQFFKGQQAGNPTALDQWVAGQAHFAGDEEFPQWLDEQRLILVGSSYKKIPAFYIRDAGSGRQEKLRVRDISLDDQFSYRNGRLVYAAYEPDIRWRWYDYSVIRLLDIATNKQRTLTHRSRYFAPDISEDGSRIVAVQVVPGTSEPSQLHLLSSEDGRLLKALPNPDGLFYTYPKFFGTNQVVTAARNRKGEMALGLIDTETGHAQWLTNWTMRVIGFPTVHQDTIAFTATQGTADRLFIWTSNQLYRFLPPDSSAATGQYQLQLANGRFVWTAFTAAGYRLQQGAFTAGQLKRVSVAELAGPEPDFGVSNLAQGMDIIEQPADTSLYPVTPYPATAKLINVHSWRPFINDPDYTFSLLSDNVLNTLQSEIYFNYNRNEKNKQLGLTFTYAALFPWLRAGTSYTIDRPAAYGNNTVYLNEWQSNLGLLVPLNFSRGRQSRYLTLSSDIVYNKRYFQGIYKDTFDNRAFAYGNYSVSFSNQSQRARMQLYPRWAQSIQLNYRSAITLFDARQFLANAYWYFPGLLSTHHLVLNTAFQQRDTLRNHFFSSSFPFARGYEGYNYHQLLKLGANYHLPLVYPDAGIANIVYFQRVRANCFFDFTRVMDYTNQKVKVEADFRSYGMELFFDTKWWNQHEVNFGIRYSRLLDGALQGLGPKQWEFILPVNLLGAR
ncbi:MAG: hypothetical protein P0Y53_16815 [Candidatus Pseudobacter hemicellulosilyticus]|uniref:Uncharacterized protein n=1 Tax=Candidatus Pseudobacter hemicellulosilyticus TaxID=3121375 RepID=A0AAJ5WP32_9BACT|nr:MAG: hypothetical protein P0Y53_16815 [Pseudobacter sp.]